MTQYLRRIDEDANIATNVGDVNFSDFAFPFLFFLVWNSALCTPTILTFAGLIRGEYENLIPLLCPHWMIGFIIPMYIGSLHGIVGYAVLSITFLLPYSAGIISICMERHNEESQCSLDQCSLIEFFKRRRNEQDEDKSDPRIEDRNADNTDQTAGDPNTIETKTIHRVA
mmetsp:Transcript_2229/g.3507  ORF Transcript_2229/g.3507 Transcript_2229/m.3507 type:complete len:170 (+) Transcript_2229:173-682(+)